MPKQEDTVRVRRLDDGSWVEELPDGTFVPMGSGSTDWARLAAMTEEDIEYNALMDPDFEPFLTDEDRKIIKTLPDPKRIRRKLKLTQVEFSRRYAIPLGTLRDWERRARFPDSAARAYLRVISQDPERIAELLAATTEPSVELVKAS
jgi:putative transcriptional regulator